MKRVLLLLFVLAAVLLPSLALANCVAYYKFDETSGTTAADSWGTYPGTLNGGCTWVAGHTNNGLQFNGTNAYVSLAGNPTTSLNDFTIACWVYLNTNNGWNRIFDFGTGTNTYMCLTPSAGGGVIRYIIKYNGSAEQQINGTAALPIGSWQFVAITLSGSTGTLYVNGAQVGTNAGMTLKPSSLGTLTQKYIGKSQYNDPYLNGIVDDFQIIGRALTASEITGLYNGIPLATHTITASAGSGGTITPSGAVVVIDGDSQTFTITPNFAYAVSDVLVDGVSQGAVTSYTFSSNAADHTIAASFATSSTVSLSGTVTAGGVPTGAATVSLYSDAACTQLATTAATASNGSYTFPAVPQNTTCYLQATQSGYAPSSVLTVAIGTVAVTGADLALSTRRYEAEDPANTRVNIAANVADAGASGGFRVGKQNQAIYGGVTFNGVTAATHGMYAMTLRWFGFGDVRRTGVAVNGIDVSGSPFLCQTGGYNSTVISVPLIAGGNTIAIYGVAGDWGPHWDYIDIPPTPTGDFYTITSSAGANGAISPLGLIPVAAGGSQTFTITPNFAYQIADVLVDGVSNPGAVTAGSYTFSNVTANGHTIAASFSLKPTYAVSGQVTRTSGGAPIVGAKVYVSTTANASVSPTYILTTDAGGNYTVNLFSGTWYICASATGYTTSADTTLAVGASISGIDFSLDASGKNIPEMDKLIFSLYGTALTMGATYTNPWPLEHPKGSTAAVIGQPQITTVGGAQWEQNRYATGDGYRVGYYTTAIPVNGVTATAVVQPNVASTNGNNWSSVIDVMYSRLILCVRGTDGMIRVCRNGEWQNGPSLTDGQKTVLTVSVQPTGQYQVFANGILVMNITTTSAMTSLDPTWNGGGLGFWSYITVGRNNPDGWTTYAGNIGAAFLWKTALTQGERIAFESELGTQFGITMPVYHTVSGRVVSGGSPLAGAVVSVSTTPAQTFTSGADGTFSFYVVAGSYNVTVSKFPYASVTVPADATSADVALGDIVLSAVQPLVDVRAAGVPAGSVASWSNTGSLGGAFVPVGSAPVIAAIGGKRAVSFSQTPMQLQVGGGAIDAPASILGSPTVTPKFTMSAWIYRDSIADSPAWNCGYLSWTASQRTAWMQYGLGGYGWACDGWASGYPQVNYGGACPPAGSWYHFVVTNDGAHTTVWIRNPAGFSQTATTTGAGYFNVDKIYIGEITPSVGRQFVGSIASLQIYDIPVTAGDLPALDAIAPPVDAVTYTVTATAGAGGTVTPAGVTTVIAGGSVTYTIAPAYGYNIGGVLVDGSPVGAVTTYTFSALAANHTISASFTEKPKHTISGKVTDRATGANIVGATVYFSATPNAFVSPFDTAITDASGNYTKTVYDGAVYVSASATNYYNSADTPVNLIANVTGVNFKLVSNVRHTPVPEQLLFSALTDVFPNSGATGNWPTDVPVGGTLTQINNPAVAIIDAQKWDNNLYASGNGYRFAQYANPIPCTGATIIAVVKPTRNGIGTSWTSVVDIFYDRLVLGVRNSSGLLFVRRNGTATTANAQAIPDGQKTVISLVVQPDGSYKVYTNGTEIAFTQNGAIAGGFTSLVPGVTGGTGGYGTYVNVGRNNPDGWTVFNGDIGDVFVYTTALTDAQRSQLEWDLYDKFGIGGDAATISGKIRDFNNGEAGVPGATISVQVDGVDIPAIITSYVQSGPDKGNYTAEARLNVGDYFTVHATKTNFVDGDSSPNLYDGSANSFFDVFCDMTSISTVNISGTVTDFITGVGAGGVKLIVHAPDIATDYPVTAGPDGTYSVDVAAGLLTLVLDVDPVQTPLPVMLTDLASRTIDASGTDGLWTNVTGEDLLVSYPSAISGRVVTTDASSPAGYAIVATDEYGATTTGTTASDGTYSVSVMPGYTYTVTAKKSGYVTMPGPRTVDVALGNHAYTGVDFTATPTTIQGILKDAATGLPIYNGVVQSGDPTGPAAVTGADGSYSLPAMGCGGAELYGDAVNYTGRLLLVTPGTGSLRKDIALTAAVEPCSYNENMEDLTPTFKPTQWTYTPWDNAVDCIDWSASPTAKTGLKSLFYCYNDTNRTQYAGIYKVIPLAEDYSYNFYFSAKADPEVKRWQPMVQFYDDAGGNADLFVSADPLYRDYSHMPPYDWHTYFLWENSDSGGSWFGPAVRFAPKPEQTQVHFIFLYEGDDANGTPDRLPPSGKGCYIDDLVLDAVPSNLTVETVAPDANATDVANLDALKAKAGTGETVRLTGTVTVVSKGIGRFFVGEERCKGAVMVVLNGHTMPTGSYVTNLKGIVTVDAFSQYTLTLSADPAGAGSGNAIAAMGMNNRVAKTESKVLTNYVRVWGHASGNTISDGYTDPITVKDPSLGTGLVVINGVLWKDTDGSVVLYQDRP